MGDAWRLRVGLLTALLCAFPAGVHLVSTDRTSGDGEVAGGDDGVPCPKDNFLLLSNTSCLPCPTSCAECLPRASDVTRPCRVCNHGNGLILGVGNSEEVKERWTLGGACEVCTESGMFETAGSGGLRLNLVGAKQEEGYTVEGRLEVRVGGRWGAVCDDDWSMENSKVVCQQLGLGIAVGYDKQYDLLHPYLPPMDVLMDDLNCTGQEESILECGFIGATLQNCETTETIGVRCSGPELQGPFCVEWCPRGQYADVTTGVCMNCTGHCLSCQGGSGAGEDNEQCTSCQEPYFLMHHGIGVVPGSTNNKGSCVSTCPLGYYGNTVTRQCQQCDPPCRSCTTGIMGNSCTSCRGDFRLFERTCMAECPAHTVLHITGAATCLRTCPQGFYAISVGALTPIPTTSNNHEQRCAKCAPVCQQCSGSVNNCTACSQTQVLQPSTSGETMSCVPKCMIGYYPDQDATCRLCKVPNCTACLPGGRHCSQCTLGYMVELGRCVATCTSGLYPIDGTTCGYPCPDGYYGNMTTQHCEPCAPMCRACVSPDTCTGCYGSRYLKDGACVKDCGTGYLTMTFPHRGGVRLLGGPTTLEGGVQVYKEGVWRQVCGHTGGTGGAGGGGPGGGPGGGGRTLDAAYMVCKDLQLGETLLATYDGRFSASQTANLSVRLHCHGNESSILECEYTNQTCQPLELLSIFCSGPDLGKVRECHVTSSMSCDQQGVCAAGVECTDLPGGTGSRCGMCPLGMHGDGQTCEDTDTGSPLPPSVLLYPSRPVEMHWWPEHVQLTLPVVVAAARDVQVTWRRGGVTVRNNQNYRLEEWGGLTLLNPSGKNVSGQYTCDITSSSGNMSAIYTVTATEAVMVKVAPRSQTVGSRGAALRCQGQGHPVPKVTWLKDGWLIQSVSAQVINQGTLILRDVRVGDAGRYTCVLTNGFSKAVAHADVTVNAPARIVKKSAYSSAVEGHPFSVNCDVIGGPVPAVYWKKDGEDLPHTDRIKVVGTELTITEVLETDSGVYRCVARNPTGSDVWKTNMTVLVPPRVVLTPDMLSVTMGTSVRFRCQVSGRPLPTVTWRHGNQPQQEVLSDKVSADISVLTLSDVTPEDTGHVTCLAENEAGTVNISANLTVMGPPQWVVAPSDVWALNYWYATLRWGARGMPDVGAVWFRDGLELRSSQRYSITEEGLSFLARYPSDSGTYTLQASNSQGVLVSSAHLEVVRDLPAPLVRHITSTNMTMYMGSLPSEVKGVTFEVLIVRAGYNETRENLTTSPLDVEGRDPQQYMVSNITNTSEGYVGLVFDRLPRLLTVGDGKRYASATTKRSVLNVPLVAGDWYAVAIRLVRYSHVHQGESGPPWSAAMFPVGATNYTLVLTGISGALEDSSTSRSLQTAAGVVLGVVLCLVLVSAAFLVFYWRRTGQVPCLTMQHMVLLGRVIKERTLSTTEYITKFNPHPGSGQFKPEPLGDSTRGTSSETISTSVSTVYIPTEDEIDSLESIGIHYYEDENWITRVPSGVLSISQSRLDTLQLNKKSHKVPLSLSSEPLPSTSKDETGGYLHRTWSEPSLPSTPSRRRTKKQQRVSVFERTNSDPAITAGSSRVAFEDETPTHDGSSDTHQGREKRGGSKIKKARQNQAVQRLPSVDGTKKARFTEPEAEGEQKIFTSQFHRIKSNLKMKTILTSFPSRSRKWKSELPETSEDTAVSSATSTPKRIISKERRRRPKIKHFKSWRDKGLRSIRDRSSNLWLQGRKWAKHVLDRHDAYGIQKSEDSDSGSDGRTSDSEAEHKNMKQTSQQKAEKVQAGNVVKKPAKRVRTNSSSKGSETGSVDLDCVYIDPASIVSIPLRKMHSSGKAAPKAAIKAFKSFPVSRLELRGASITSVLPQDLEQFRPKAASETSAPSLKQSIQTGTNVATAPRHEAVSGRGDGTAPRHEAVSGRGDGGDQGSPVILRMIGKLKNRKDAEAQTDSELDDDDDDDDVEGDHSDVVHDDIIGSPQDTHDSETRQFKHGESEVTASKNISSMENSKHDTDNTNTAAQAEAVSKAVIPTQETIDQHTIEDDKTEVMSLSSVEAVCEPSSEAPSVPPPRVRAESSSPDPSNKNDSSNDSSDYLELLDAEVKGDPGKTPCDVTDDITDDVTAGVEQEADLYQSLSSFDSLTHNAAADDGPPAGTNDVVDDVGGQCEDVTESLTADVGTERHIAHKDSLVLPRYSPRSILSLAHVDNELTDAVNSTSKTFHTESQQHWASRDTATTGSEHVGVGVENRQTPDLTDSGFHANIQSVMKRTPPKKLVIPDAFRN